MWHPFYLFSLLLAGRNLFQIFKMKNTYIFPRPSKRSCWYKSEFYSKKTQTWLFFKLCFPELWSCIWYHYGKINYCMRFITVQLSKLPYIWFWVYFYNCKLMLQQRSTYNNARKRHRPKMLYEIAVKITH